MRNLVAKALDYFGYALVKKSYFPDCWDMSAESEPLFARIYEKVSRYTMTSRERCFAQFQAVRYIVNAKVAGDIVECGVWRGGSMMLTAYTLMELGCTDRTLYLYDTFEGMSLPSERDIDYGGKRAEQGLVDLGITDYQEWCYAPFEDVKANLLGTGYPTERVKFIKGKVEETIPATLPSSISVLRLDTDWYESTSHELRHLYPQLSARGVLVIDDYGHWRGARQATDEYLAAHGIEMLLHRIDFTGRIGTKV